MRAIQARFRAKHRTKRNAERRAYYWKTADESRRRSREYKREQARERAEWFYSFKRDPCEDCGERFHPVCMDFDHRPGSVKVADVSVLVFNATTLDREAVLAEIAKCDLVCANCHRLRTFLRREC